MKYPAGLALLLALTLAAFAQIRATTEDGRSVLLNKDGTWSFADQAVADTSYDFRQTRWGMSRAAVQAAEAGTPVAETEQALVYDDSLAGLACRVTYTFAEDRLAAARYDVMEKHEDKNAYVADFKELKELLTAKYGKPEQAKTRWISERYKGKPQHWGLAASMGEMVQYARWELPKTTAELKLGGGNFRITLALEYASRALQAELDAAEKAKLLKDF